MGIRPTNQSEPRAGTRPLLATKLAPPHSGVAPIVRSRLGQNLDEGLSSPLVVVSAAAGSGKTVVVSEWAVRSTREVGWLSLDSGDNDAARFWRYFNSALQTAVGGLPSPVGLELSAGASLRPDERLDGVINHLVDAGLNAVVVLDDYHLISNESIAEHVTFLVERGGGCVCLVVLTRGRPQLPLARLRSRGLVAEISADSLAMTVDEAAELLDRELSRPVTSAEVDWIHERTEGWAVGVYLAALSLKAQNGPAASGVMFGGDDENIVEYLGAEVLSGLEDEERHFLVRTSILDRFCPPLCTAVTGEADAPRILERLAQTNGMIVSLDTRRYWHRYHHLFADFLRRELERAEPDRIVELHLIAARWLAERGLGSEAIAQALAAHDWELAAGLVVEHWKEQRDQYEVATVVNWLESLPAELIEADSGLLLARAWTALADGRLDEVERVHDQLGDVMAESGPAPNRVAAEYLISRATVRLLRGDTGGARADAVEATRLTDENRGPDLGRALTVLGAASFWLDSRDEARATLTRAVELAEADGAARFGAHGPGSSGRARRRHGSSRSPGHSRPGPGRRGRVADPLPERDSPPRSGPLRSTERRFRQRPIRARGSNRHGSSGPHTATHRLLPARTGRAATRSK